MTTLPTIGDMNSLVPVLKIWQKQLNPVVQKPPVLRSPFNFRGVGSGTGNALSWEPVTNADGYEIQSSTNGDFFAAPILATLSNSVAVGYFDSLGAAGIKRYYRVRATGTVGGAQHAVKGTWTAPITSTSGSGSTTYDTTSGSSGHGGWNPPGGIGGGSKIAGTDFF